MSKGSIQSVNLSRIELAAAFEALSNYTPPYNQSWKQAAQTRAVKKIELAIMSCQSQFVVERSRP